MLARRRRGATARGGGGAGSGAVRKSNWAVRGAATQGFGSRSGGVRGERGDERSRVSNDARG